MTAFFLSLKILICAIIHFIFKILCYVGSVTSCETGNRFFPFKPLYMIYNLKTLKNMSKSEKDKLLQMKIKALDVFQKISKDMKASTIPRFQEFIEEYKKGSNANLDVLIEITCQIQANTYLFKYIGIAIDNMTKAKSVNEFYRALFITINEIEKA